MAWIQSWVDRAYLGVERLLGTSGVARHWGSRDLSEQLTAYAVAGFEIRVYCQKRVFVRTYYNRWGWSVKRNSYHVFARVSSDAPKCLQNACELELDLPSLRPWFVSEELHKQAAVGAYLDILLSQIQQELQVCKPKV